MMECKVVANSFFLKYGIKEKIDRGCSNVRKMFGFFRNILQTEKVEVILY